MRQGEVWTLRPHVRAVIISSDEHNDLPGFRPIAVPLVRGHGEPQGLAIPTHQDTDHVSGVALPQFMTNINRVDGTPDSTLSGTTMHKIMLAVQEILSY